jgi:hypothetical protein
LKRLFEKMRRARRYWVGEMSRLRELGRIEIRATAPKQLMAMATRLTSQDHIGELTPSTARKK